MPSFINKYTNPTEGANNKTTDTADTTTSGDKTSNQGAGEATEQLKSSQEQLKDIVAKGQEELARHADQQQGGGKKTGATHRYGKLLGDKDVFGAEDSVDEYMEGGEEQGAGEDRKDVTQFGFDDAQTLARGKAGGPNEEQQQQQQQKFAGGKTRPVTRRTAGLAETNVDDGNVSR